VTLVEKRQGVWEGDECLMCHRRPARKTKVQSLSSFLIIFSQRRLIAPLCRDHAVDLTREHLHRTLKFGWWGVGLLVMPIFVPVLLRRVSRAKEIPPPEGEPALPGAAMSAQGP
jgi:hypothetical protein